MERTTTPILLYGKTDPCVVEALGRLADTLGLPGPRGDDRKVVDGFATSIRDARDAVDRTA